MDAKSAFIKISSSTATWRCIKFLKSATHQGVVGSTFYKRCTALAGGVNTITGPARAIVAAGYPCIQLAPLLGYGEVSGPRGWCEEIESLHVLC